MIRWIALLLAAMLAATPGQAQTAAPSPATEILIPFSPPLDTVLRFRVTKSKDAASRPPVKASWIEEMRFVRSGDGFILYWRIDGASLPPEMRHPAVAPMIAAFTGDPIAFDLDLEGTLLRVREWHRLLPRMLGLVDSAVKLAAQRDDKVPTGQISPQIRAMFERLDAETATAVLLKNIAPALNWGGIAMRPGTPVTESAEQEVPLLGGKVLQHIRVTMTALDPGKTATIEVRTENDRDSVLSLVSKLSQQFGPPGTPEAKARMEAEMGEIDQMSVTDRTIAVVDLPTGLPRTIENSRKASAARENHLQEMRIEWLR